MMDFTAPDGFCVLEPWSSPDVELGWFDKSAVWDKRLASSFADLFGCFFLQAHDQTLAVLATAPASSTSFDHISFHMFV